MARSLRSRKGPCRSSDGSDSRVCKLRFSKEQVKAFKRPGSSAPKAESRPSKALLAHAKSNAGRKMLKSTLKPARSITRVVLKMWNGSKIALYPAETLALRCGKKVYKYTIKASRIVKIA